MIYTLKNLSGIPLDVPTPSGPVILPANGELTVTLGALDAAILQQSPYVEISEGDKPSRDPLDHDGDGRKGGSKPASEAGEVVDKLRAEYKELTGKDADGRWKADRIQSEIDKALEA